MDWARVLDNYCERTDPGYWSEPVNALTNLAFLIAAFVMGMRTRGMPEGQVLSCGLAAIGVGSWLFHTHATFWAAALDVVPILLFSIAYVFLAIRDFLARPVWVAGLGAVLFLPYSALLGSVFGALPFFQISAGYWPLPVLILAFAILMRGQAPATARNLAAGAVVLCISLTFRSLDNLVCEGFPLGTHFAWHLLNAVMLGWMIETWRRHSTKVA